MKTKRNELLVIFEKLDPENRADVLAHVKIAYAAQEHTKKRYEALIPGPDTPLFNGGVYALRGAAPVMAEV
ncbi:hypothetical protein AGMMS49944_09510 [Spirochaetia bacterium]|nr:hypothetical protein AGMMS49944_09510 [Spirochaetia bacterium]